jgi:hypothetical protein
MRRRSQSEAGSMLALAALTALGIAAACGIFPWVAR